MNQPVTRENVNNLVMMHVWIHSHHQTGKPTSIDVFEIDGRVNMNWHSEAMEPKKKDKMIELAETFYEHMQETESSAWFLVSMGYDAHDEGGCFCYPEVITRLTVKS